MTRKYAYRSDEPSKTQQHFTDSCDVNNIVSMFTATGIDPSPNKPENQKFGFATSQSFSEAMQKVAYVNSRFAELPSATRSGFGNDPARWLSSQATPTPTPEEIPPLNGSQEPQPDPDPDSPKVPNEGEIDIT